MTLVGTLLLISNDPDLCRTVNSLSNPQKFDTVYVGHLEDAVKLLRNGLDVDLVIFDQPKRSPAVLLEWVARDRICVVSTSPESFSIDDAASLGISHVFTKPLLQKHLDNLYASAGFAGLPPVCKQSPAVASSPEHRFEELDNNRFFSRHPRACCGSTTRYVFSPQSRFQS